MWIWEFTPEWPEIYEQLDIEEDGIISRWNLMKSKNDGWQEIKQGGNEQYKTHGVEPIDLYRDGGILQDFVIGCIIKYAYRNRSQTKREPANINPNDIKKIKHYADMLGQLQKDALNPPSK